MPEVILTVMVRGRRAESTYLDVSDYDAVPPELRNKYLHNKISLALTAAMDTFPTYTAIELMVRRSHG